MSKSRPPFVLYPIMALLVFVFFHSMIPSDARVRMGIKPFEPELGVSLDEIWYSVKKWRHILWFAFFFPLMRTLFEQKNPKSFRQNPSVNAFGVLILVTILIEFEECFVAGRHGRVTDLLPNIIGAALGAWVYGKWFSDKIRREKGGN